jgi:hypothetical protein
MAVQESHMLFFNFEFWSAVQAWLKLFQKKQFEAEPLSQGELREIVALREELKRQREDVVERSLRYRHFI